MEPLVTGLVAGGAAWAAGGLAVQVLKLRAVPRDFAVPAGRGATGVRHAFTTAMRPSEKESVARHPVAFAAGLALHGAIGTSLVALALAAAGIVPAPTPARVLAVIVALGLLAGGGLLVKRALCPDLRSVSVPDDVLAALAVLLLLGSAAAWLAGLLADGTFGLLALPVLVYAPLGKLRHAIFFFLARGHFGWRLGLRGTYGGAHGR